MTPPAPITDPASAAIEAAVRRWAGLIVQAASRHGLTGADVDEVVQSIRIRLWRALGRPNEKNPTESASYVYRAAMSASVDLLRRRRSGPLGHPADLDDVSESLLAVESGAAGDEAQQIAALGHALNRILPERRVAVRLHLEGKTRDEIAEFTGWNAARTRNLLYRGLADLKAILQTEGDGR